MIFKWRYQLKSDLLNTNLDAHTNYEIKCNDVNVPFVKKFTLLGVTLDEYLIFDTHTISLCAKVNWKVSVLKKSSYLFDINFKITLFKLFIISKYDYCSTLFFHFNDKRNEDRLEKNFAKAVKSYLNIKIRSMDLEEQYQHLKSFRLLPLKLRFFQNLVFFIFTLVKIRRPSILLQSIDSLKKTRVTRQPFSLPISNTNLYINSFLSISIRLLNSFIFGNLIKTELTFRSEFKKVILSLYKSNMKHWTWRNVCFREMNFILFFQPAGLTVTTHGLWTYCPW